MATICRIFIFHFDNMVSLNTQTVAMGLKLKVSMKIKFDLEL